MCESNNKPPVRLDNLLLGELLGQGGMGQVWAATHAPTQQPVAIKVNAPQQVSNEHAISEFFREAHAVARLRHPSILSVYDLGLVSAEAAS